MENAEKRGFAATKPHNHKNNNVSTETESILSFSPFVLAVETVPDPGTLLHGNRRYALPSFPSGKLWFQALELWFLLFKVISLTASKSSINR